MRMAKYALALSLALLATLSVHDVAPLTAGAPGVAGGTHGAGPPPLTLSEDIRQAPLPTPGLRTRYVVAAGATNVVHSRRQAVFWLPFQLSQEKVSHLSSRLPFTLAPLVHGVLTWPEGQQPAPTPPVQLAPLAEQPEP